MIGLGGSCTHVGARLILTALDRLLQRRIMPFRPSSGRTAHHAARRCRGQRKRQAEARLVITIS